MGKAKKSENENSPFFIVEMTKVILWPLITIILIIILFPYLRPVLKKLPDSLGQVESISYSSFKIELREKEFIKKDSVLSNAVDGLSKDAMKLILEFTSNKRFSLLGRVQGSNQTIIIPDPKKMQAIGELLRAELLEFNAPKDTIEAILRRNRFYVKVIPELGLRDRPPGQVLITDSEISFSELTKLRSIKYYLSAKGEKIYELIEKVTLEQSGLE